MIANSPLPLRFTTQLDTENVNRGWVVDVITAFHGNKEVGYLKISYIPKSNFLSFYPSIFNWMHAINGKLIMPCEQKHDAWQSLAFDQKQRLLSRIGQYMWAFNTPVPDLTEPELDAKLAEMETDYLNGELGEQFTGFQNFHVDKPMVDFIRVYDATKSETGDDFRRQGIGTALYQQGALYAQKRGMSLWASGIQSEEAQGAWAKMTRMGWTTKQGKRMFLKNPTHLSPIN